MDIIAHTTRWALGDALQGKVMLSIGILTLVAGVWIFKADHPILKGMLIPLGLVTLIGIGYGGFLAFARPGHINKVATLYQTQPEQALQQELEKAERDHRNYTGIQKVWPVLIALAGLLLFFLHGDYQRGLLIGLLVFFVFGLMLDTFLHHRLTPYLEVLRAATGK